MSDQSIISRREALMAAVSVGAAVAVADAGDQNGGKEPGSNKPGSAQLKLSITLTDGQVVTFNAREAVIDFGASGQLLVQPSGVMPVAPGLHPGADTTKLDRTFNRGEKEGSVPTYDAGRVN